MDDLENLAKEEQVDSDVAPMSPFADALTKEEEKQQEDEKTKKQFIQSVQAVSSASETDENGASGSDASESKKKYFRKQQKSVKDKAKDI